MKPHVFFVKESQERIWGLTPSLRIKKVLGDKAIFPPEPSQVDADQRVLIFRGDFLFDDRLVRYLASSRDDLILFIGRGGKRIVVAASVRGKDAIKARDIVLGKEDPSALPHVPVHSLESLSLSFFEQLKKFEPPFVLPVGKKKVKELEDRLFDWSYKGVTDLVTKWLWPKPAKAVVRACVQLGIRPNHVTFLGFILVIIAGYLFYQGYFAIGLLAAWLMTFLDTVDGKLARVTVTSSRFGHYFDHLIDLVHPPLWYILWGVGLESTGRYLLEYPLLHLYVIIVVGYVVGRLVEGIFQWKLGSFGIFCWRPVDSVFRLVTARRNPCLLLLTFFWLLGRPDYGLLAVALWTGLTSGFLVIRLIQAIFCRLKGQRLVSWLSQVDRGRAGGSLLYRWFVKGTI